MTRSKSLEHRFVEFIPESPEDGVVYVSIEYATVVHKCCCGCGLQVVTPFSPTDWELTFDGETVSLYPSIGNWGFPCRSHYWIKRDKVVWAAQWTPEEIRAGRARDARSKQAYYERTDEPAAPSPSLPDGEDQGMRPKRSLWGRFRDWLSS